MQLVIAEKPSVARDLARALGIAASGRSAFEGNGRIITWCVGHLAELAEPGAYDVRWRTWRLDTLPIVPERFSLTPSTSAPEQFRAVRSLLRDRRVHEVVNACDAGREGELIFRYVYELAGARVPTRRLWLSSMTDDAIRRAFSALEPGSRYDALADAARSRAEADWLVGMNATRAATLTARSRGMLSPEVEDVAPSGRFARRGARRASALFSVGRVQTPTLALLVERERAIRAFVPRDYWELQGAFRPANAPPTARPFRARWIFEGRSRLATDALGTALSSRVTAHARAIDPAGPRVELLRTRAVREPPPQLFDLTSLQRTANRRFGFPAARTLALAQSLYERHKVLTYPRTDSRHLSRAVAAELAKVCAALARDPTYGRWASPLATPPTPALSRRFVDDGRVSDHHAIIPTAVTADLTRLDRDEQRVYDLVVRRFLGAFQPDAEFDDTLLIVRVGPRSGDDARDPSAIALGEQPQREGSARGDEGAEEPTRARPFDTLPAAPDRFVARGRVRTRAGWQEVAGLDPNAERTHAGPRGDRDEGDDATAQSLPSLREGDALDGVFSIEKKQTRPPSRYSEAMLLGAMERGETSHALDDKALERALRDAGLGTPATRAAVIETLLERGYATREHAQLRATVRGESLIDVVSSVGDGALSSAELTGRWEARLARIARGEETRAAFMRDIESFTRALVEQFRAMPPPVPPSNNGVVAVHGPARPSVVADRGPSPSWRTRGRAAPRSDEGPEGIVSSRVPRAPRITRGAGAAPTSRSRSLVGVAETQTVARKPSARRTRTGAERPAPGTRVEGLTCPICQRAEVVTGRAAWGCSRWREGCALKVPFECAGKTLTEAQLRELLSRGHTRRSTYVPGHGPPVRGRLVFEASPAPGDAMVRFEPAA